MPSLEQQLLNLVKENPSIGREIGRILSKHEPQGSPHKPRIALNEAKVSFDIPPIPADFKTIEPGTSLWIRYWKAHPELQMEMLRWKNSLTEGQQYASTKS